MKIFVNKEYQYLHRFCQSNTKYNYGDQLLLKLFLINLSLEDYNYAKHISSILTFCYKIFNPTRSEI